jgi:CRP/FNR family cyclic AMP-dependent transcriptional regulator
VSQRLSEQASDLGAPRPPVYKQIDLLGSLDNADRSVVLGFATPRRLRRGAHLYQQREPPRSVHVVTSGLVRTYYKGAGGEQFTIGLWSSGDLVGAPDLVGPRRVLSALAHTDVETQEFTLDSFDQACRRVPAFGLEVIKALSFKVRWVTMIVANVTTKDARWRLCELLLVLSSLFAAEEDDDAALLVRKFSLGELGMMIGASRQWTTRAMGELRDLGAVRVVEGGYLRVYPTRLREAMSEISHHPGSDPVH